MPSLNVLTFNWILGHIGFWLRKSAISIILTTNIIVHRPLRCQAWQEVSPRSTLFTIPGNAGRLWDPSEAPLRPLWGPQGPPRAPGPRVSLKWKGSTGFFLFVNANPLFCTCPHLQPILDMLDTWNLAYKSIKAIFDILPLSRIILI